MLLIDRHDHVAQSVIRRVQTHSESHGHLGAEFVDLVDETGRGDRHAATRQTVAVVVKEKPQRRNHVGEILQRFTHAHQHNIADNAIVGIGYTGLLTQRALGVPQLTDDFGGSEIAG